MAAGVTVAGYTALLLLGYVAGIVFGLAGAWLSWLWGSGSWRTLLAGVALVAFLAVLYAGCRLAGWAMRSRLGAGLPALGWVLAFLSFTVIDGIEVMVTAFGLVFQLGSVVAVMVATMRTEPVSPGPVSPARRGTAGGTGATG